MFRDEIILFKLGEFEVFFVFHEFSVVNPNKPVIWKISEELQNLWHPNFFETGNDTSNRSKSFGPIEEVVSDRNHGDS